LEYVTIAVLFLLPIFLLTLLGAAGVQLTQRLVPVEQRKPHNAAIGIIYGGLYVLFGEIVEFTSLLVLNNYNAARVAVQSESGALARIYELSQRLPESKREEIQGLAESYACVVVEKEWPLLVVGHRGYWATHVGGLGFDGRHRSGALHDLCT